MIHFSWLPKGDDPSRPHEGKARPLERDLETHVGLDRARLSMLGRV